MAGWRDRAVITKAAPEAAAPKGSWRDRASITPAPAPAATPAEKSRTSVGESLVDHYGNPLGAGGELGGAIQGGLARASKFVPNALLDAVGIEGRYPEELQPLDVYRDARDDFDNKLLREEAEHPVASAAGNVAQAAPMAAITLGAGGPLAAAATGAGFGAGAGIMGNDADLTDGVSAEDVKSYLMSTGVGGLAGAGAGLIGSLSPALASGLALTGAAAGKATGKLSDTDALSLGGSGLIGLGLSAARGLGNRVASSAGKEAAKAEAGVARQVAGHHDVENKRIYKDVTEPEWLQRKAEAEALYAKKLDAANQREAVQGVSDQQHSAKISAENEANLAAYSGRKEAFKLSAQEQAKATKRADLEAALKQVETDEIADTQALAIKNYDTTGKDKNKDLYSWWAKEAKDRAAIAKIRAGREAQLEKLRSGVKTAEQRAADGRSADEAGALGELGNEVKGAFAFADRANDLGIELSPNARAGLQNLIPDYAEKGNAGLEKFVAGKGAVFKELLNNRLAQNQGRLDQSLKQAMDDLAAFQAQPFDENAILSLQRKGPVPADEVFEKARSLGLNPGRDPESFRFWEKPALPQTAPRPNAPAAGPSKFDIRRQVLQKRLAELDAAPEPKFTEAPPEKLVDHTPEFRAPRPELELAPKPERPKPLLPRLRDEEKLLPGLRSEKTRSPLSPDEQALIDRGVQSEIKAAKPSESVLQELVRHLVPDGALPPALKSQMPDAAAAKLGRNVQKGAQAVSDFITPGTQASTWELITKNPELLQQILEEQDGKK